MIKLKLPPPGIEEIKLRVNRFYEALLELHMAGRILKYWPDCVAIYVSKKISNQTDTVIGRAFLKMPQEIQGICEEVEKEMELNPEFKKVVSDILDI